MRVFVTGATGFIGSAIVPELLAAGHQVIGMTRSEEGAATLKRLGAEPHFGKLEDLESLKRGALGTDGVIHTAFDHDFSRFVENCEKDRRAIAALGDALAGSDRLLLITSGTGMGTVGHGEPAVEDHYDVEHPNPRKASEEAGQAAAENGVKVAVVRLPQVHDTRKQGLISPLIETTRQKGVSAYVGEGEKRWPAAHLSDVARLYRLAFEKQRPGVRYHAVAEEGVPVKTIAEVIGRRLGVPLRSLAPDQVADHFGWMARFAELDLYASSDWTRTALGWRPTGPGLLADLEAMHYEAAA